MLAAAGGWAPWGEARQRRSRDHRSYFTDNRTFATRSVSKGAFEHFDAPACVAQQVSLRNPRPTAAGNRIANVQQLEPLKQLSQLHSLDLEGCPLADEPTYRFKVFEMLAVLPHFTAVDELNKNGAWALGRTQQERCGWPMGRPPTSRAPSRRS